MIYEDFESCKIITCQSGFILKNNVCIIDFICPNGKINSGNQCIDITPSNINLISSSKSCDSGFVYIDNVCTSYITEYNFTNCSAIGRLGPTLDQCKTAYNNTNLKDKITMETSRQGIQIWTVPLAGRYLITCAGAGLNLESNNNCKGVIISSVFTLNINDKIKILVGQSGVLNKVITDLSKKRYSGSGGTFVVKFTNDNDYSKENNIPMIIAGGAGGINQNIINSNTLYNETLASFYTSGQNGLYGLYKVNGGINGESRILDNIIYIYDKPLIDVNIGTPGSFYKDGNNLLIKYPSKYYYGYSFLNGGNGALCDNNDNFFSVGGFGGGSAAVVYLNGSGGGYSGGAYSNIGSGGGSYSSEKMNIIGYNNGMGYVNIKYLGE